jgi:hypothetical protein
MRAVVLCLNFPVWRSCSKRSGQGNKARGNRTLIGEATSGNVEFVNVLKTTDWIRGGAAVEQADVRQQQTGFETLVI